MHEFTPQHMKRSTFIVVSLVVIHPPHKEAQIRHLFMILKRLSQYPKYSQYSRHSQEVVRVEILCYRLATEVLLYYCTTVLLYYCVTVLAVTLLLVYWF